MKTIVLYKSKYGSTKKYAEWLADELQAELAETGSLDAQQLAGYDTIIVGGNVHAGGLNGIKWLKKNYGVLKDKQLAVFAVGASPDEKETIGEFREQALGPKLGHLPFFYLRGVWDEAHMTWPDRQLCKMLKKAIEKKPPEELVGWETALLEACETNDGVATSWMSTNQLQPIAAWART